MITYIKILIDSPEFLAQLIINGLLVGAIFALIAYGLALIWGVMDIINFAQGEMVIFGGYITYTLFYQFGISGIIAGVALSHIPYVFVIFKELKKTKIDLSLLIPRKEFIINNYLIVLSGSFSNQIDKFIIVPILGFALLGEYSLALQILVMLTIVNNIIFKYILPQDSIGIKNYKLKRNSIIFSVFIAIFGSILLPFIIPTIFTDYVETVDAIRIISWVVIPDTIILIYTSKLLGLEKSKFVLTSNIISTGILIVGFILLGPIFGILGLAGMVLFSACIQCIILYFGKRNLDKGSVKGEKNVQY